MKQDIERVHGTSVFILIENVASAGNGPKISPIPSTILVHFQIAGSMVKKEAKQQNEFEQSVPNLAVEEVTVTVAESVAGNMVGWSEMDEDADFWGLFRQLVYECSLCTNVLQ